MSGIPSSREGPLGRSLEPGEQGGTAVKEFSYRGRKPSDQRRRSRAIVRTRLVATADDGASSGRLASEPPDGERTPGNHPHQARARNPRM